VRDAFRFLPPGPALAIGVATVWLVVVDWQFDTTLSSTSLLLCAAISITAIWVGVIEHKSRARVAIATVVIVTSVSIASVGAEFATRWIYRDITTTGDERGFFTKRWTRSGADRLNSLGFREHEFDSGKAPGVYRIAVVGDSFTYGNGLATERRFSNVIQRELPDTVQVLNFGVPGDNTPEHAALLEHLILSLEPNFVLVQWFVNDVEGSSIEGRPTYYPLVPIRWLHLWLYDHSALYTLLNASWTQLQAKTRLAGAYDDYIWRRVGNPESDDARKDRAALERLVALGRSHDVPVGFVLFPDTGYELGPSYPFAYLHERMLDFCRSQQLTCVDLRPEFAKLKDRRQLWVDALDHHPSAQANMIAAVSILQAFGDKWTRSRATAH
jgi:hypothetical protein